MKIYRVVITGAPCSGKTKIIDMLYEYYKKRLDDVFVCPEAASQLITEGSSRNNVILFQKNVFKRQCDNEKYINKQLKKCQGDIALVLYDRGLVDCYSYVDDIHEFADEVNCSVLKSYCNYDMAIMLEICDKQYFENNGERIENYQKCLQLQDRIKDVYVGHPHLRYIKNQNIIADKFELVKDEIDFLFEGKEIEKKFLIKYPDIDRLWKLKPFKAEISQTYLLSSVGSHRIRKRGANGEYIYFETLKIRISGSSCYEDEKIINEDEYNELLKNADPDKKTINKYRYCFLYDGKYFELDIFDFWNDRAFLEIELKDINEKYVLPPFIEVIKDVSDDEHYKNNYLAGLKL